MMTYRNPRLSRISRLEEKRTKRQLILSVLGIVVIIILFITIGIPLVIQSSVMLGNLKSKTPLDQDNDKTPPFPPTLFQIFEATNSAQITLEGYGEAETTLTIYQNRQELKKVLLGPDGNFSFSDIFLKEGQNTFTAVSRDTVGNESSFSKEILVEYKRDAPKLEITQPQDNQVFEKSQREITIVGKTDPGNDVRINNRYVAVQNDGSFIFNHSLSDGENILTVISTDRAGNFLTLEKKVTLSP